MRASATSARFHLTRRMRFAAESGSVGAQRMRRLLGLRLGDLGFLRCSESWVPVVVDRRFPRRGSAFGWALGGHGGESGKCNAEVGRGGGEDRQGLRGFVSSGGRVLKYRGVILAKGSGGAISSWCGHGPGGGRGLTDTASDVPVNG